MAKVGGPLFSLSASGKIADAMVFFSWKGRNVVRQWLKPSNPQTAKQGQARMYLGGLGRACSKVQTEDLYAGYAREVAEAGQTWVSAFVKWMIDNKFPNYTAFDDYNTNAANATSYEHFAAESLDLELVDFNINPKLGVKAFNRNVILYALADYGYEMRLKDSDKFVADPYATDPDDWTLENVQTMVTHMNSEL